MSGFLSGLIPWDLIHDQRVHDTEQDRISNEEFQWTEDMANMHNDNEITRQGDFLRGMVDPSAQSYNAYQDQTYGADTDRQIGRIQDTAAALKMSPWELNGGSAATPLPSGDFLAGKSKNTTDADPSGIQQTMMNNATQRDIAAMNNTTSLANTAMQTGNNQYLGELNAGVSRTNTQETNATSRANTESNNATSRANVVMQTFNGQVPQQQVENLKAQARQVGVETWATQKRTDIAQNQNALDFLKAIANVTPTVQANGPGFTYTAQQGYQNIIREMQSHITNDNSLSGYIKDLSEPKFSELTGALTDFATDYAVKNKQFDQAIGGGGFLGNMLKRNNGNNTRGALGQLIIK